MAQSFLKDVNAILDYAVDWTSWLTGGETISTSAWTVPTGITKVSDSKTTVKTTVWLSGGTAGTSYELVNRIKTNSSPARTEDRTIRVNVTSR